MSQTMIQMAGITTGGTQNALVNIDIPQDGTIKGVDWTMYADFDADTENMVAELSFIATGQITTNDARGMISQIGLQMSFTTSGASLNAIAKYVMMDLEVSGGERIYINSSGAAGVSCTIVAILHFEPARSLARRSRRRT